MQTLPQVAYPAMLYGVVSAWQADQPNQAQFRQTLSQHAYPADTASAHRLQRALDHLETAQLLLSAVPAFREGTLTTAYSNPFSQPLLSSLMPSLSLLRASRLEAETVLVDLLPLQKDQPNNSFI